MQLVVSVDKGVATAAAVEPEAIEAADAMTDAAAPVEAAEATEAVEATDDAAVKATSTPLLVEAAPLLDFR